MRKFAGYFELTERIELSPVLYKFTFRAPEISKLARPGQFIQVRTSDDYYPFWPRPFSIYDTNPESGEFSIIFKLFGCGTSKLANKSVGDQVHLLGPLGNGFELPDPDDKLIMAAGGVGLPPLYLLSKFAIENGSSNENIIFISGAKTKDELFNDNDLNSLGVKLIICTDDGSSGKRGTVVDILKDEINTNNDAIIYSCGPSAMLERVDKLIVQNKMSGYISLEQLMPCGYGICSGCAVKVVPPEGRGETDDNRAYHLKRVCHDGPVFKSGEVIWE